MPAERRIALADLRVAWAAAVLLTRYWWSARRGAPPAALAARVHAGTWRAVPARMADARVIAVVSRVARVHPLRPGCLPQALAGCHLLRSGGRDAAVRLGIDRQAGTSQLRAHAWVHTPDLRGHEQHAGFVPLGDIAPARSPL